MLNGFKAVVYKEFIQVRRDPATKFVFVIPVIQLILFGYAIDTEVRDVPTVVFNADRRTASREFLAKFDSTDVFRVTEEATDAAGVRVLDQQNAGHGMEKAMAGRTPGRITRRA